MPGLKRHPALQDLSRDHHRFLLEAQHIRWLVAGDERALPLPDVIASLLAFWELHGAPHLREEETILLPLAVRSHPRPEIDIPQVQVDHDMLRSSIQELRRTTGAQAQRALLAQIGQHITAHIRYEERVVFQAIQAALSEEALQAIGEESLKFRRAHRTPEATGPYTP